MKAFILKYICFVLTFFLSALNLYAQVIHEADFEYNSSGWSHYPSTQTVNWQFSSGLTDNGPSSAQHGSTFFYVNNKEQVPVGEVAILKAFDFSNYTNPVLSFYYYCNAEDNLHAARLAVETQTLKPDDANYHKKQWDEHKTIFDNQGDGWVKVSVCLSSLGGKQYAEIKISSTIVNTPCANVAIDNLKVENFIIDDSPSNFENANCYGGTGKITIKPIGGGPNYQYSLDNDNFDAAEETTQKVFNNVEPRSYQLAVRDVTSGCIAKLPHSAITILEPAEIKTEINIDHDVTCYANSDGSVIITASESTGNNTPYYYSVSEEKNQEPTNASNRINLLHGGIYYVRVKNSRGCYSEDKAVEMGKNVKLQISEVKVTDIVDKKGCYGDQTGEIYITAETSTGDIYYSIDGGTSYANEGFSSDRFGNLSAGSYNIVVKDRNGCKVAWQDNPVILKEPEKLEFEPSEFQNITGCNGDETGWIQINVKGGTKPLAYYLNSEIYYSENGKFENLAAGDYTPIVKDINGCKLYTTNEDENVKVTISQPTPVEITEIKPTDVLTCFGDNTGSIEVVAKGGTAPLYYLLTQNLPIIETPEENPEEENQEGENQEGENQEGENQEEPEEPQEPVYVENNLFESLSAGSYTITVKDANGCPYKYYQEREKQENDEIEIILNEPQKFYFLTASGTSVSNLCFGDEKGQIYVSVSGGTQPFIFNVTDNADYNREESFTEDIGNIIGKLPAGNYTVSAKDKNNCKADEYYQIEITEPEQLVIQDITITNVDCYRNSTGKATLTANGGTGNYSYGFKSASAQTGYSYSAENVLTGFRAGKYDFTVKDANKCEAFAPGYEISEPAKLQFSEIKAVDVLTCYGDAAGTIALHVQGGVGPYQYSIDDGNSLNEENIFNDLKATNYYPHVVDANGCITKGPTTPIYEPTELVIKNLYYNEVEGCHGTDKGSISFDADGGSGQWKFSIDTIHFTEALKGDYPNLKAGTYYPIVEDSHGCRARAEKIEITEADPMEITSIEVTDALCFGKLGGAEVKVQGGREFQKNFPYNFFLNGSNDPFCYDGKFDYMEAGTYSFEVKDKYNCTLTGSFTIMQPDSFAVSNLQKKDILTCYGDKTGEISVDVKGGTSPFTFAASGHNYYTENSTGVFKNIPATSYVVRATDKNGCVAEDYTTLEQPEKLIYSAELTRKIECHNQGTAEITVTASGGTGNLSYSVDGGISYNYADSVITGLQGGQYKVRVRDANGCTQNYTDDITVINPAPLEVTYEASDLICNFGNTGQIAAQASGGTRPYFFSLDSVNWQQVTGLFSDLNDGEYIVYVHDQNNCAIQTNKITLLRPKSEAGFTVDQSNGCTPLKVVFTQEHKGLLTNYYFSNGDQMKNQTAPAEYTFVNDSNKTLKFKVTATVIHNAGIGCSDTSSMYITVYPLPEIDLRMIADSVNWPENTASFINMTNENYSMHWDFGDGSTSEEPFITNHKYDLCGNYNIILTANDGTCENKVIKPFKIEPRPLRAIFSSSKTFGCQPLSVSAKDESQNADSCEWDFGDGSEPVYNVKEVSHKYNDAGDYVLTLTVYGDCGSKSITTKKINVFDKPAAGFEQNLDTLYSGQYLKLEADAVSADMYKWSFGDGTFGEGRIVNHKYEIEGTFSISLSVVTANSCADTATTSRAVTVVNIPVVLYPNAFSPNGDGKNDIFKPIHGNVAKFKLVVLNRKGVIVFQTTDIEEGWDGTRNGKPCPVGMYVWKAVSTLKDKQTVYQKGNLYLFR